MVKKLLVLAGLACLAGCTPPHFKDVDSYGAMFREGEAPPTGKGDPYTFGGIGEGSGGLMPRQTYADDSQTSDFRDATETGKMGQIDKDRTETADVRESGGPVGNTSSRIGFDEPLDQGTNKMGLEVSNR